MKRNLIFALFMFAPFAACACAQAEQSALYSEIEPLRNGYLQVSELHEIYWEVCGNPDGIPVIVLHGGPGGSAGPRMRRFFDPERFCIILHDQRGAGRSRPAAEWRQNTTQDLVADINRLREHLGVDRPAILFGGSWGSTLALAYAEAHTELVAGLVLRGVFTARRLEIEYFYHGGAALFYPQNWERLRALVPDPESLDYPRQLFEMTQSDDPETRRRAIDGWARYEIRMISVGITDEATEQILADYDMTTFSVLENYYMMNGCFLEEGQLLRDADRIAHLPTFIVNGRFDAVCPPRTAYALAQRLENVVLELPQDAGHSDHEPSIEAALVRGAAWVADQLEGEND